MASNPCDTPTMEVPLPTCKISVQISSSDSNTSDSSKKNPIFVVLVLMGSFNPPTYMHMRMFELARDELESEGYNVIGGYMSPVNDAYSKKGLLSADHRICMCELACETSTFVMVDSWEAKQSNYQRSLVVLNRVQSSLKKSELTAGESLKVMLLCGSDLLESFVTPGVWIRDQVKIICRDFGVVCIHRDGKDIEDLILRDEVLNENKSNIIVVDELIQNQISSTRLRYYQMNIPDVQRICNRFLHLNFRECIQQGKSIKYLTADSVIDYIKKHQLYVD